MGMLLVIFAVLGWKSAWGSAPLKIQQWENYGQISCAILENGGLKCWGRNDDGRLGLGDTKPRFPEPGKMGNDLPYVELGPGVKAKEVAVTGDSICVLITDGTVKCWGTNHYGELGYGDSNGRGATPATIPKLLPAVNLG